MIEETYGAKAGGSDLFEYSQEEKDHNDDDGDMSATAYYSRDDDPPILRAPLEVLEERTDRDESEATFHESAVVSLKELPTHVARHRRASLSNYLGSSFDDAPVHPDGSEFVTMGPTKARRASLSDYIASNDKIEVSAKLSVMTIVSNETG